MRGVLEYPALRKKQEVFLADWDRQKIVEMMTEIDGIISDDKCPPVEIKALCRNCSYYEFCYSKEIDE